ncbi:YsnF/AvaK domain-containing protein (plasmid) [Methylobacterium sp. NMS12]|uniref:YsnF/AvaK domain-containing protein n=1 Tax=Methylobacterium sp. NMS12 TaxID=3079766 RepID=UPI003F8852B0
MSASAPDMPEQRLSDRQHEVSTQVASGETRTIPVVEETARIEKRAVETGRVRVRTDTETHDQILRESLRSDSVAVTRVPVNRTLVEGEAAPVARFEDGVTIIPVLEEILVVEKRLVLKEEVHIRQTSADEDVEVPVTLRRQHAVVERVSPDGHASEQVNPLPTQETTS